MDINADIIYKNVMIKLIETGCTVTDFCKCVGIPKSTLYRWKGSKSKPHNSIISNIANFFKCSVDDLIYLSNDKKNIPSISNTINNNINSNISVNNQTANIDIFKNDNVLKMYTRLTTDNKNKVHEFITNLFIKQNLGE